MFTITQWNRTVFLYKIKKQVWERTDCERFLKAIHEGQERLLKQIKFVKKGFLFLNFASEDYHKLTKKRVITDKESNLKQYF